MSNRPRAASQSGWLARAASRLQKTSHTQTESIELSRRPLHWLANNSNSNNTWEYQQSTRQVAHYSYAALCQLDGKSGEIIEKLVVRLFQVFERFNIESFYLSYSFFLSIFYLLARDIFFRHKMSLEVPAITFIKFYIFFYQANKIIN